MITPYLAWILTGVALASVIFLVLCNRAGLPLGRVAAFTAATSLSGLLGGRAYIWIEQGHFGGVVDGSFRLPGVVLGALAGLAIWQHIILPSVPLARLADLGAPAVAFGQACARLGCLAAGCCFGTVTDLPWAIQFPLGSLAANVHSTLHLLPPSATSSLPVHPLQIYFLLWHLAVGICLLWFRGAKAYDGQVVLVGLLLGEGGKAVLESFRQPIPGIPMAHLQVISATIASAAALALVGVALRRSRVLHTRAATA